MKRRHAKTLERFCGSLLIICTLAPDAMADAQGWNRPGWYVSSAAPVNKPSATPNYVLFNGPYVSQGDCALIYARLYPH